MNRLAGVSQVPAGTEGIHLAIATIPLACAANPHYHVNCESAIYVVKGRGRFLSGEHLQNADEIGPGDFIYVPANSVHSAHQRQHVGADGADSSEEHAGRDRRRVRSRNGRRAGRLSRAHSLGPLAQPVRAQS